MIDKKRRDLETFIREQTLGPGAMRGRFVDLREDGGEISGAYAAELMNTIPAGIYSTGVLFPVDETKMGGAEEKDEENEVNEQDESFSIDLDEENDPDDPEEENVNVDAQSLNQMYPNSIGLTVCLDQKVTADNDLEIVITGRHYERLKFKESTAEIGVLLEQDRNAFIAFMDRLPASDLIREGVRTDQTRDGKDYIYFSGNIALVKDAKKRLYEVATQECIRLSEREEQGYRSLDLFKARLFEKLKREILPDSEKGREMVSKIREIEMVESTLAHLHSLISIYDPSGYGLWKCSSFRRRVGEALSIPTVHQGKIVYSYQRERAALADIWKDQYDVRKWASLSVNLQYSKHGKAVGDDNLLYLKVQLLNTSKHFSKSDTKNGKNYFSTASEEVNRRCFFGVGIEVRSRHLRAYHTFEAGEKEKYGEEEISRYIYRQYEDYGIGHGCSVKWDRGAGGVTVATEYIPTHETPDVDPVPRFKEPPMQRVSGGYFPRPVFGDPRFLQFKWLSTLSATSEPEILDGMRQFVEGYADWIEKQQDRKHPAISSQIRADCLRDQLRMSENIELLLNNKEVLYCFRLMNTAMFMQLWHSVKAKDGTVDRLIGEEGFGGFFEVFYREKADDVLVQGGEKAAWRPFQLAFILLNLDGIFQRSNDPAWDARKEWVDLVWFPTGGGKTEAYLGLIALTIINRRRRFKELGGGTAVLMRYTLRLLTTQQFQRATLLIMALELMRRWGSYDLGDEEPIYIGLFVGSGSLPNRLDGDGGLEDEFNKLRAMQSGGKQGRSRIPLQRCPWCGHELNPIEFHRGKGGFEENRILLACSRKDKACAFSSHFLTSWDNRQDQDPIPVSLCDEEIYQHPPALLFGTVDKFAQLAHKVSKEPAGRLNDSRRLFGTGNWETEKPKRGYPPPDLIIQDELHLMMGPLGSAVALFESAIDQLCTREIGGKTIRPKIISSTATTRNTPLQIMALFDRQVNLFPKPGVDCDDSFFAFYKRVAGDEQGKDMRYTSKRRYIGILPTGRTQMWMQLRLAAILFTHRALFEKEELGMNGPFDGAPYGEELQAAIDNYHTVLAYFNSLREVGKTESQVYSYLVKEIRRVFNNVMRPEKAMHCFYTYDNSFHHGELTGRLSGEEVVNEMDKISRTWSQAGRCAHGNIAKPEHGRVPPDLVIATNMISVGIDISRLNSMIINCMPRNIAEYIQASSRVARSVPGLVITVHHPFRSRDLSHYERFIEFHEKMYSYVEPISITPFTLKALERYLPLYIATMIRHHGFPNRTDANSPMDEYEKEVWIKRLVSYFERRKNHLQGIDGLDATVKGLLVDENITNITELVKNALTEWQNEYRDAHAEGYDLVFNFRSTRALRPQRQLYVEIDEYQDNVNSDLWRIPQSLRVVDPEAVIHVKQK